MCKAKNWTELLKLASLRVIVLFVLTVHFCTIHFIGALVDCKEWMLMDLNVAIVFQITAVYKVPGTSLSPGWIKWALIAQRTEF